MERRLDGKPPYRGKNEQQALRSQRLSDISLAHDGAVGVKQGQLLQIDQVGPLLSIALGQNGHAAADLAAGLFHQSFQGFQAFAGGDDIVHDQNFLSLDQCSIGTVQIQLLLPGGGDGIDGDGEDVPHVQLGSLPGKNILGITGLTGHFMGQGNALGFGGENVVIFRGTLQQLPGTGYGQLLIAKDYEAGNVPVFSE